MKGKDMFVESSAIVRANVNQQTNIDPAQARRNIEASRGHPHRFDPQDYEGDPAKPVVFVGGGSTAELETVLAELEDELEGEQGIRIMAVGSAALRLNRAAQEAANPPQPVLARADAVVINEVYGGPEAKELYNRIAKACEGHPGLEIYLASYCSAEAYAALPQAQCVNAVFQDVEYPDGEPVLGLGSTAPTASTIIAMAQGHTHFEYVGVTGAILEPLPKGFYTDLQVREIFRIEALKRQQPDRYAEYKMPPAFQRIANENKLLVRVGDKIAGIPSGQWYQLEEMRRLVEWARGRGMVFNFHGDNSLSEAVLMKGQAVTLAHDPRGKIAPGARIEGTAPAPWSWYPEHEMGHSP